MLVPLPPPLDIPSRTRFNQTRALFTGSNSGRRLIEHESGFSPPRRRVRMGAIPKSSSVPASLASICTSKPVPNTTSWSPSSLVGRPIEEVSDGGVKDLEEDSTGTTYAPSLAASSTGVSSVFGKLRLESPMELSEIEESDTVVASQSSRAEAMSVTESVAVNPEEVPSGQSNVEILQANLKTSPIPSPSGRASPALENHDAASDKKID